MRTHSPQQSRTNFNLIVPPPLVLVLVLVLSRTSGEFENRNLSPIAASTDELTHSQVSIPCWFQNQVRVNSHALALGNVSSPLQARPI